MSMLRFGLSGRPCPANPSQRNKCEAAKRALRSRGSRSSSRQSLSRQSLSRQSLSRQSLSRSSSQLRQQGKDEGTDFIALNKDLRSIPRRNLQQKLYYVYTRFGDRKPMLDEQYLYSGGRPRSQLKKGLRGLKGRHISWTTQNKTNAYGNSRQKTKSPLRRPQSRSKTNAAVSDDEFDRTGARKMRSILTQVPSRQRQSIIDGLKSNWQGLQSEYQRLPIISDTRFRKQKKEDVEKRLRQLEHDIELMEVCRHLYTEQLQGQGRLPPLKARSQSRELTEQDLRQFFEQEKSNYQGQSDVQGQSLARRKSSDLSRSMEQSNDQRRSYDNGQYPARRQSTDQSQSLSRKQSIETNKLRDQRQSLEEDKPERQSLVQDKLPDQRQSLEQDKLSDQRPSLAYRTKLYDKSQPPEQDTIQRQSLAQDKQSNGNKTTNQRQSITENKPNNPRQSIDQNQPRNQRRSDATTQAPSRTTVDQNPPDQQNPDEQEQSPIVERVRWLNRWSKFY